MNSQASICIIEDESIIAHDIAGIVSDLGYGVSKILHHSDAAIDFLSFHSPDLVLCDIKIKGPKDGIAVAQTIRAKKAIPFVFLTSLTDSATIARAREALPYGYIIKPFDEKDLLSSIEIALYKYREEVEKMRISKEKLESIWSQDFTQKEYEIITEMIRGTSYSEMLSLLKISNNTLKYHTKNIFSKCAVANRAELLQTMLVHFVDV